MAKKVLEKSNREGEPAKRAFDSIGFYETKFFTMAQCIGKGVELTSRAYRLNNAVQPRRHLSRMILA